MINSALSVERELAGVLVLQWFGDLVTPIWWDDIWLNEGFASYMELLGVDNFEGTREMQLETQFVASYLHSVMNEDSLASSRPIYLPVSYTSEITSLFDAITYDKVGEKNNCSNIFSRLNRSLFFFRGRPLSG